MSDTAASKTGVSDITALSSGFGAANDAQWLALIEKALKGADFEKRLVTRTADGLRIAPLYTRGDGLAGAMADGPRPLPQRADGAWDICQFHAETDAAKANTAILEDLEGGATSIALEIADPAAFDFSRALDDVLLDICGVSLIAGESYRDAASRLVKVWTERGVAALDRQGGFYADPLGWLAMMGGLSEPVDKAVAAAGKFAGENLSMPNVKVLAADGAPYNAAGASEAQELAAMLATLVAYLRAAEAAGLAPDKALPKIDITLAVDDDQFLGIAKLRAARRLVARVADASGATDAGRAIKVSAVTAWRMMAKRDPWTNMLRTTVACAAAALGGADRITVLPYTFALGKTDRFARRIARNTHIVLQEESSLARVADPAGGSWYVERLTDDLARKAWDIFQDIEARGGMAAVLMSGYLQETIAKTAEARAKAIASGKIELTGVSAFPLLGDDGVTVEPWPSHTDNTASRSQAHAVTIQPLKMNRLAEPFEALRDAADAMTAKNGARPLVFMASLGSIADHTIRSTWVKNYLAAGGIETQSTEGFSSPEDAAGAFKASGALAACISSSDKLYAEHAEASAQALKAAGCTFIAIAGKPGEREAALRAAGVDVFLAAGQNAVTVLAELQRKLSPLV